MGQITKEFLQEVEKNLYWGGPGGKTVLTANDIVKYIRLAYEGNNKDIPEKYKEFSSMMKIHWTNMNDMSLENQKKYLQDQVLGLYEHIKSDD